MRWTLCTLLKNCLRSTKGTHSRRTEEGGNMNLADFIQTTLEEILKGVRAAQHPGVITTSNLGIINPGSIRIQADHAPKGKYFATIGNDLVHLVQFDVAVTTEAGDKVSGGGKISVLGVGIGSEGSVSSKDMTVSRIKFEVPITLPTGSE